MSARLLAHLPFEQLLDTQVAPVVHAAPSGERALQVDVAVSQDDVV